MANNAGTPSQQGVNNEFVDIQGGFQEIGNDYVWKGSFFHKSKQGPFTVTDSEQFIQYLNSVTIRSELGESFFDSFQEYKITGGEISLFDITTPQDKAAAGVVYIAPYPWSTKDTKTQDTFNVKALPGCQWKAMTVPMTNFSTSNKFPLNSIGNTQMLTVGLGNPVYFIDTAGETNTSRGNMRQTNWVVTNSGYGSDNGRWYGWIINWERYSNASDSTSIGSTTFHFIVKYHVVLRGFRPVTTNQSGSRRKRSIPISLYPLYENPDGEHIFSGSNGSVLNKYEPDSEDTGDGPTTKKSKRDSKPLSSTITGHLQVDEISAAKVEQD